LVHATPLATGSMKWLDRGLAFCSRQQCTVVECAMLDRNREDSNYKIPSALAGVKDSLIGFLNADMTALFAVEIELEDLGIVSVQALVLRHGLLLDREGFSPVADLSVCWLQGCVTDEVAKGLKPGLVEGDGFSFLRMSEDEYALFQNLCDFRRATVSPALRKPHPDLLGLVPDARARKHFRRVLMPPLYPSAAAQEGLWKQWSERVSQGEDDKLAKRVSDDMSEERTAV